MGTLAELIDKFRAEAGYPGGIRPRRDAERAGLAPALSRSGLDDPDVGVLRQRCGVRCSAIYAQNFPLATRTPKEVDFTAPGLAA